MHSHVLGRLAGLGLAVAWLCTSAPTLVAQAPPAVAETPGALRVFLPDAGTPVADRVTVRFSEPMVAEPGGNPGALDFLHLSPDVPVRLQWQGTDTLAIAAAAGGFPIGRPVTLRIAAGARALSGARLPSDVSTTFTARPVSATMEGRRRASDRRVVLVIRPDRELSPAMAKALLADIHYQPYVLAEIAPSTETRDELTRRDPRTLARIEASQRAAAASASVSRRVVVRPVAGPPTPREGRWLEGLFVAPNDLVVETIDVPPPDVRLIVGAPVAANASEPKVAPWEPRTRSRLVKVVDTLRLLPTRCGTSCAANNIGVQATLPVDARILQGALRVVDITDPAAEQVLSPAPIPPASYPATSFTLTSLGYSNLRSGRRYRLSAETGLKASGGQAIAEPWVDVLTTALREPLAVVGNRRDAVWEAGLGPRLPVVARTLKTVEAGAATIPVADLPTALNRIARSGEWASAPKPALTSIPLAATDDTVLTPLVDVSSALGPNGRGFVWLVAQPGVELPRSDEWITVYPRAALPSAVLVQVTNLGVTVRTFGDSVLVFVTTLDAGVPVPAATVTILDDRAQPLWRGATDAQGVARTDVGGESIAAGVPSLVLVEHGDDRAFGEPIAAWNTDPWLGPSKNEALEGVVFTDRGVYRPGESVHVKAILRRRAANRIVPLAPGTPIALTLDRGSERLARLDGRVGAGGGVEWTVPLAADVELSAGYLFTVHPGTPAPPASPYHQPSRLTARVAIKEVRPLEFEVEATMTRGPQGGTASEPLGSIDVRVAARDLTGVPLRSGRVSWTLRQYLATPFQAPAAYAGFAIDAEWPGDNPEPISGEGRLDSGAYRTRVDVPAGLKGFGSFVLEAEIVDGDTSQAVTTTLNTVIHPDAYLGVAADAGSEAAPGASVRVVALDADGRPVAGVPITLIARSQLPEGRPLPPVHVVSGSGPIAVSLPGLDASRRWTVEASGGAAERIVAPAEAYAEVTTPTLAPSTAAVGVSSDKLQYAVGDRARITVRPPWSTGSALVTIERHRIVSHHVRRLDGRPIELDVPIDEEAVGGLSVSAIIVKGRTGACCGDSGDDPGAPAVVTLDQRIVVDPASARLQVAVEALTPKPGPGAATRWRVGVTDAAGRPARAEVVLWAVDEGWLRLTEFTLPDVAATLLERELPSIYEWDSRRALLRRTIPDAWGMEVQTSSGMRSSREPDVQGDGRVRTDRRPVAFWFGDLRTGDDGSVTVDAPPLPETLTTYRVFAVAATASRFGQSTQPLVVTSPVMLRPSVPRFLTRGDRATIPIAVTSLQDAPSRGRLTIESLTPDLLAIDGEAPAIALAPGERRTITIGVRAIGAGQARLRVRIVTANATDAVEHTFPIVAPVVIERTVVSGPIDRTARAVIAVPRAGIDPAGGGLTVSVSASLLAGVSLAGEDLEAYAYLCLEQRTSRMLALALAAKEGGPFAFVPVRDRDPVKALQQALRELPGFRCAGEDVKGYGLWNGACRVSSPYLSAYLLYALQTIRDMAIPGIEVDEAEIDRAADAVEAALRAPVPATGGHLSEGWAALGLKALADEGRYPADAGAAVLARRDTLPLWAIAHLYDALQRADPGRPEQRELEARLLAAITAGGVTAQVVTPATDGLDWTWPSHGKTTAIVLDVLARHGRIAKVQARALATGLMQQRRADGGWVSTQENAWALIALATYRHEVEGRDDATVAATVDLGGARLIEAELCGEHDPATRDVSMRDLLAGLGGAPQAALAFTATGDRPAFFTARLEVQRPAAGQPAVSHGIAVTRRYEMRRGETWVPVTSATAGDVVRVTVTLRTDQSRSLVALSDPLPAGFEAIDPELSPSPDPSRDATSRWSWWGTVFDHVQRRDGRIDAFATRLPANETTFEYHVRATTAGTFFAAPPHAGQMYEPEVYGRGAGETIVVRPAP